MQHITMDNIYKAIVDSIRQFLLDELTKKHFECTDGSTHRDLSYINFSEMIRIDLKRGSMDILVHLNIVANDNKCYLAMIWLASGKNSYKTDTVTVDIISPNFGDTLEVIIGKLVYIRDILDVAAWHSGGGCDTL